jgi:hypothetical protein
MSRRSLILAIIALFVSVSLASADTAAAIQTSDRAFKPIWTIVGAGGGFGLGVWAGLHWFDDAIHSDRKVWTTAILSAAAGGVLGYLVDRHRARPRTAPSRQPALRLPEYEAALAGAASRLGTGELKRWLDHRQAVCSTCSYASSSAPVLSDFRDGMR